MGKLKLKITERCNANCLCCQSRLERYAQNTNENYDMSFVMAKKCIDEAKKLGWDRLIISGGEPTLNKEIDKIIDYGKASNMLVSLYTNGSTLSEEYIDSLEKVNLDVLMLSYYSKNKNSYVAIRQSEYVYNKASEAIRLLAERKKSNMLMQIRMQTVLTKYNYEDLPELLLLAIDSKFNTLSISFLEHATSNIFLYMEEDDIEKFKGKIVPELIKIIEESSISETNKKINQDILLNIQKGDFYKHNYLEIGEYRDIEDYCINKDQYLVVAPSGQVLPCCGVEYYLDKTEYGNVNAASIEEILNGTRFRQFWKEKKDICKYCGLEKHFFLLLD